LLCLQADILKLKMLRSARMAAMTGRSAAWRSHREGRQWAAFAGPVALWLRSEVFNVMVSLGSQPPSALQKKPSIRG
jgi:hypothetical protein